MTRANRRRVEKLAPPNVERGHALLELAFSSLATRPQLAGIIAGAIRPEQVEQNAAAAERSLDPGKLVEVDRMTADP